MTSLATATYPPQRHQQRRRFRLGRTLDDFVGKIFNSDSHDDLLSPPVRWIRLIDEQSHTVRGTLPNPTTSRTDAATDEHQNDANARGEARDRQSMGTIDAGYDHEERELSQQGEGPQSSHDEKPGPRA